MSNLDLNRLKHICGNLFIDEKKMNVLRIFIAISILLIIKLIQYKYNIVCCIWYTWHAVVYIGLLLNIYQLICTIGK